MAVLGVVFAWLVGCCALLALAYRRAVAIAWREPVLSAPVLILESDDWGYGSIEQAQRLDRIADLLGGFRDAQGHNPVMTLGVVLAGPDTDLMRAEGCRTYHRMTLSDPRLAPVRDAMLRGAARGVFGLQLHGMEHYWPACLMRTAQVSVQIRDWLTAPGFPATETLPPPLQSRWIDATDLPSERLSTEEVTAAAGEEIDTFAEVFGIPPEVVVPPTFVWTVDVEKAWARAGMQVVVTPGKRADGRDESGRLIYTEHACHNGAASPDGLIYVVRDSYFEPSLGHTHQCAIQALQSNTGVGRPTLLEIHRVNFVGEEKAVQHACEEVRQLLAAATAQFPNLQFMSTAELARRYRDRSDLVEARPGARVHCLLRRLAEISRLRKLAWATGVALPAWLAYVVTRP